MNNTIIPSRVKFSITAKHLLLIALLFGVAVIFLFAVFFLTREKSVLIEYLPKDTPFWFWQKKGGYDARISSMLEFFGIDQKLRNVLEESADEIILYQKDGEWYRLAKKDTPREENDSWRAGLLFSDLTAVRQVMSNGIGFMSSDYFAARFSDVLPGGAREPYYFSLQKSERGVSFAFVPKNIAEREPSVFNTQLSVKYDSWQDIALAFQSDDQKFIDSAVKTIKKNILSSFAFLYPVIIEKQLSDGTISREKVAKQELFFFQEIEKNLYSVSVDTEAAKAAGVLSQLDLDNENFGVWLFDDGARVAVGFSKKSVADFGAATVVSGGLVYMAITDTRGISTVEILGKTDAFLWLQKSEVKSIAVEEDETGYIKGEMRF